VHNLPPGPKLPAVAQLVAMSADPYGFFERCQARYGDVFTVRLPGQPPTVIVSDPEAVRSLVTGGYDDVSRFAEAIRFLLGDHSVIFLQDTAHRETRRLMVPPFHGERMRAYGNDMARITDDVLAPLRDGERRSFHQDMQVVTLRTILRCVFGITEERRLVELGRLIVEHLESMMTPWFFGATLIFSGPRVRELLRAWGDPVRRGERSPSRLPLRAMADRVGAIDAMLFEEIARCRRLSEDERAARTDILSMLVGARFDDGSAMADDALRDHLMTLLIGGHETTATALAWVLDDAMKKPGTIARMRDEVAAVMKGGFDPGKVKELAFVAR
jgi:cytochrome P450